MDMHATEPDSGTLPVELARMLDKVSWTLRRKVTMGGTISMLSVLELVGLEPLWRRKDWLPQISILEEDDGRFT